MKKFILEITIVLIVGLLGAVAIGCCGCVSVPRGPVFTWNQLTPGRWEARIYQPRCPGCPQQTNVVWCPATYGWQPVAP